VQGDLDLQGSDKLLKELMKLEEDGDYNILVDLGKVEFVCSFALGALISTLQYLKKHNGTLKLLHLQEGVMEKFKITKLIREFDIYESEEDALRSYGIK
jgi:anti-sigma B factor antagonist